MLEDLWTFQNVGMPMKFPCTKMQLKNQDWVSVESATIHGCMVFGMMHFCKNVIQALDI